MGFVNISPYASTKGAIESLAKCLNIEYADPKKVGVGLAKSIHKKSYVICHSFGQKLQTMACYLFPLKMGRLMSKMTKAYANQQQTK